MNELVQYMQSIIARLPYDGVPRLTDLGYQDHQEAHDILSQYRGDSRVLIEAVQAFGHNESLPYAYAGTASVLIDASFLHDDKYDADGLKLAEEYLAKARAIASNDLSIELAQVALHRVRKQYPAMRSVLDKIATLPNSQTSYARACSEADYWQGVKDDAKYLYWRKQSIALAKTEYERMLANTYYAQDLMFAKKYYEAIEAYKQVEHLSQNDPWYFHNVSILYMRTNQLKQAAAYNKRALSIAEFGAAQQMTKLIRERSSFWYQLKRFFKKN